MLQIKLNHNGYISMAYWLLYDAFLLCISILCFFMFSTEAFLLFCLIALYCDASSLRLRCFFYSGNFKVKFKSQKQILEIHTQPQRISNFATRHTHS